MITTTFLTNTSISGNHSNVIITFKDDDLYELEIVRYVEKYKKSNIPEEVMKYFKFEKLNNWPRLKINLEDSYELRLRESIEPIDFYNSILDKYDWPGRMVYRKNISLEMTYYHLYCIDSDVTNTIWITHRALGPASFRWSNNKRIEEYYVNGSQLSDNQIKQQKIKMLGL